MRHPESRDWTFDLENAVATWRQFLSRDRAFHEGDLDELENHLRDEFAAACRRGLRGQEAFAEARRLTGEPGGLNTAYGSVVVEKRLAPSGMAAEMRYWTGLARSYGVSAVRALGRNPMTSVINIVGLSIAIACSIAVFLFLQVYGSLDSFHENGDRIFIVEHEVIRNEQMEIRGTIPVALGPALEAELPEVDKAVRVEHDMVTISGNGVSLQDRATFTDPGFFDVFTFPLLSGSASALRDPSAVILSFDTAARLFGHADVLGRQVTMAFGDGERREYIVRGVTADFPENAGFFFGILMGWGALDTVYPDMDQGWASLTNGLFVLLHEAGQASSVSESMQRYVAQQHAANDAYVVESFLLDNLRNPMPGAYRVLFRPSEAPHPILIGMFLLIAGLMMALSCFNYINISVGAALRRLREIGVRKVMGGTRAQLTAQFMVENLLLCTIALVIGTFLAISVAIPAFNNLFVLQIGHGMFASAGFWTFLVILLGAVAVLSGMYPALYISSFRPVAVLGGRLSVAGNAWFTKAFLTAQFTLAFMTVLVVILVAANGQYMKAIEWGAGTEETVVIPVTDADQYQETMRMLSTDARVQLVSAAESHPGRSVSSMELTVEDELVLAVRYRVGADYLRTLHLSDKPLTPATVFVNESFISRMGWETEEGHRLLLDGTYYEITGVVRNFHLNPMVKERPVIFQYAEQAANMPWISALAEPGTASAVLADVAELWQASWPSEPFGGVIQADVFQEQLESYDNLARSLGYLGLLAVFIATMGLFGLTSQNVSRRLKEVCVRKVLGASAGRTLLTISWTYIWMLVIAGGIAVSIVGGGAVVAFRMAPDELALMPLGPAPFILGVTLVWSVAALAISAHIRRLSRANPAEILRVA
ncbi:MAG: FtsX-like permease family protein [Rhodothermales bacterium]